jgi:tetratricopeptide (TPR) repeat protein
MVEACNKAAQMQASVRLEDYATVEFIGMAPEAALGRLSEAVEVDRISTFAHSFISRRKPSVAVRLTSKRAESFAQGVTELLSDSAKRQFSRNRPGVIWLHIDYLDPAFFDSLANVKEGMSLLDIVAIAFLDSPSRPYISQLIFSGGALLTRRGAHVISQYKSAVYNAPNCQFGHAHLFSGGKNLNPGGTLTGAKAKRLLREAKFNVTIPGGRKEGSSSGLTNGLTTILERLSTSHNLPDRLAAYEAHLVRALKLGEQGRCAQAVEVYDKLLGLLGNATDSIAQEGIAAALFNRGNMLQELGKSSDALLSYRAVINRFGTSSIPLVAAKVAFALYNSAKLLDRDPSRVGEAIEAYEQLVEKFRVSPGIYPEETVAHAYVNLGILHGNSANALVAYDQVCLYFGTSPRDELREQVKKALLNKGRVLMALDRAADALDAFETVLSRPGTSKSHAELWATFWKGQVPPSLGREREVPELCDKLVESVGSTMPLDLREAAARSLLARASIFIAQGDLVGAIATHNALLARLGLEVDWELVRLAIFVSKEKTELLASLERYPEALSACDDILARCDGKKGGNRSEEPVTWALAMKARVLGYQEKSEDAAIICSEIIDRFGPGSPLSALEFAARALAERAAHFWDVGRYEEALSDCNAFLADYESSTDLDVVAHVALALLVKGVSLLHTERPVDATGILNKVVVRFSSMGEEPTSTYVAYALELLQGAASDPRNEQLT